MTNYHLAGHLFVIFIIVGYPKVDYVPVPVTPHDCHGMGSQAVFMTKYSPRIQQSYLINMMRKYNTLPTDICRVEADDSNFDSTQGLPFYRSRFGDKKISVGKFGSYR